jgi:hypothetical protein
VPIFPETARTLGGNTRTRAQVPKNGVNVHKENISAKLAGQAIMHAPSMSRAVVAAIADEDFGRHGPLSKLENGLTPDAKPGGHALAYVYLRGGSQAVDRRHSRLTPSSP